MRTKPRFFGRFRSACLIIAEHCYGPKGLWAYECFDYINTRYFGERLPCPHILWGLTEYGSCVAWASTTRDKSRSPVITLHPSLLQHHAKKNPWGIPSGWIGPSLVFDTLLHECIHLHIDHNLGGTEGRTSHDCKRWARQVNRLAPLLGFREIYAAPTKTMRVPDSSAPRTARGKPATKVVRRSIGNVPFKCVAGFPSALRVHLCAASDHYRSQTLPPGMTPYFGDK